MKTIGKMILSTMVLFVVIETMVLMTSSVLADEKSVNLTSMHNIESNNVKVIDGGINDSYGNSYSGKVLEFAADNEAFITFDLNGKYESFSGLITCSSEGRSSENIYVGIYADGEKIYELKEYNKQKPAETFDINVEGVGKLSIKTFSDESYSNDIYFVDSHFIKSEMSGIYPDRADLSDLVVIDKKRCEISKDLFVDNWGNIHNGSVSLDPDYGGNYVLFNLDQKYLSFSGNIVPIGNWATDNVVNISFYLDDKPVFSKNGITKTSSAIGFDIDVANANVLKMEGQEQAFNYGNIAVTDCVLKQHEHIVDDWTVQTEATCTEDGESILRCEECGEIALSEKIPAIGHTPDGKWIVGTNPTCTDEGEQIQHCSVCGEICKTQRIDKLPHEESENWEIDRLSTCNKEGLRTKKCIACGVIMQRESMPMVAHSYGRWKKVSGSIWNSPIIKEHVCLRCGGVGRIRDDSMAWVKPFVITVVVILSAIVAIMVIMMKIKGLPLELASIKELLKKDKGGKNTEIVSEKRQ